MAGLGAGARFSCSHPRSYLSRRRLTLCCAHPFHVLLPGVTAPRRSVRSALYTSLRAYFSPPAAASVSLSDSRLPPFAWVGLDALRTIRDRVPPAKQEGARNALLGLAEAASRRHDAHHRQGETAKALAALTGKSERRLRDFLRELEVIGLVRIQARQDAAGRDLPTHYVLCDAGSDESSDPPDTPADTAAPAAAPPKRARVKAQKKEGESPPIPPRGANPAGAGGRSRDLDAYRIEVAAWIHTHLPIVSDHPQCVQAVDQALRAGKRTPDDVEAFLDQWWPQITGHDPESEAQVA